MNAKYTSINKKCTRLTL